MIKVNLSQTISKSAFGWFFLFLVASNPVDADTRKCREVAQPIIAKLAEEAAKEFGAPSRKIDLDREARKLCSIKITSAMRRSAAIDALHEFFPRESNSYQFIGEIPGLNSYSPSTLVSSKSKGRRVDFRTISEKTKLDSIAFVSVSNDPDAAPIVAVSPSPPYHLGFAKSILKGIPDLRRPLRVIATVGHPMAPVLVIKDGRGNRFAYSHSIGRMLSLRELKKLRPNRKGRDPERMISSRLFWTSYLPIRNRAKDSRSKSTDSPTIKSPTTVVPKSIGILQN